MIRDAYQALLSVGHNESQARQLLDHVLGRQEEVQAVDALLMAIYQSEAPK